MQASAEQEFKGARAPEETVARAYKFADLSSYPFKKRCLIRAAGVAFFLLIKLIGRTIRWQIEGWENWEAANADGRVPIYAFWHNRIFLATYFFQRRRIVVMTSQSFDGEYIARFLQRLGYGAIRGSSTRGGARGLVEMIRGMDRGLPMGFTVDGPKGPRYEVKSGVVLLAKKSGNPILPFIVHPKKYWMLNSWDKLHIPRPFARALMMFGNPIYVDAEASDDMIAGKRIEVQNELDRLVKLAKEWCGED